MRRSLRIAAHTDYTSSGNATPPPLWRNFSWLFVGSSVYVLCQWGMLSVLSKLGSPEVVGQFALGLAITTPVIVFCNLQLRQIQATDATRQYEFGDYLGLRITTTMLAFALIAGIVLAAGYRIELALVILAVGLAKSFDALSDIIYGLLQHRERMNLVSKSMVSRGLLSLVALGAGFYLTGSLLWGTVAWAATWALRLVFYDVRNGALVLAGSTPEGLAALRPRWKVAVLAELAYLALPLGLSAALISLSINIPRYFTAYYLSEYDLGIFAALSYVMVSGRLIVGTLGQSSSPRLARYYAQGDRRAFSALITRLAAASALMGTAGILVSLVAGRWILSLLYTPEYAEYINLFVWIMVATGINYVASLLNFGLTAARHLRAQLIVSAGVVGTTAVGCLILVPQAGVLGAGIALVFGQVFYIIANLGFVSYIVKSMRLRTAPANGSNEGDVV